MLNYILGGCNPMNHIIKSIQYSHQTEWGKFTTVKATINWTHFWQNIPLTQSSIWT